MHNDTVKAMAYPEEKTENPDEAEEKRQREKELIASVDDESDDDMGM